MQANGDIDVTINQLKDPAGLQATLRADGLPAIVIFSRIGGAPRATPGSLPPLLTELNGPLAIGLVYATLGCTG